MNTKQVQLVQESWAKVEAIGEPAAALFYANLFEADPSLQDLFRGDMDEQGRRLLRMLSMAVRGLQNTGALVPQLHALGHRHVSYGVTEEMYAVVGGALLKTLEMGLGEAFTPEVRAAWVEVYTLVANVMKDGAQSRVVAV